IIGDSESSYQFHYEVRPARGCRAGIMNLGNVRMVHQRQGLTLRLEPRDNLAGVHAKLDYLQGHLATNRLLLFGHVHNTAAAFADLFQQLVTANAVTRLLDGRERLRGVWRDGREKVSPVLGGMQ